MSTGAAPHCGLVGFALRLLAAGVRDRGVASLVTRAARPRDAETASNDWVVRAQGGDRDAFCRLYEQHASLVHGILIARVPPADAEDLMQEVFLVAWQRLGKLRRTERVRASLAANARNRARRAYRRGGPAAQALPEDLVDARALDATDKDPGQPGARELLVLLQSLPNAYREALALRLIEGWSGPEIARATGRSEGAVRVHLARGMQRLRAAARRAGWLEAEAERAE